jgi:hypothetical protein
MSNHFEKLNQTYQNVISKCQTKSDYQLVPVDEYIEKHLPHNIARDCFPANFKDDTIGRYTSTLRSLQSQLQALHITTAEAALLSVNRCNRYGKNGTVSSCGYEANKRYRKKHIDEHNESSLARYNKLKDNPSKYDARKERMREYALDRLSQIKAGTWQFRKKAEPNNIQELNNKEDVHHTERNNFEELDVYD